MKRHSCHIIRLFILLFTMIFPMEKAVADWNNFIINYDKKVYGKGSQTWQIAPYNENWMYFANNNGILQYDGNHWKNFSLKNVFEVRSVHPSVTQKRIYAGGIHEFGYYEPGEDGRLNYTCLSDSLSEADRSIGNIWGIRETDNILYIIGDSRIIKLLNGKYTIIDTGYKIDCSDMIKGVLYIGTDNGVFVLVGNTLFPLQGAESLATKRIRGIIPHEDGVIIVTAYDGLYYCNGQTAPRCNPLPTQQVAYWNLLTSTATCGWNIR